MDIDELPRRIAAGKPIASLNVRDDSWPEVDCDGAAFTDCVFEAVQFSYPSFQQPRFVSSRNRIIEIRDDEPRFKENGSLAQAPACDR